MNLNQCEFCGNKIEPGSPVSCFNCAGVSRKIRFAKKSALLAENDRLRKALMEASANAGKYEDWMAQRIAEVYDNLSSEQKFSLSEFGFFELIEQAKHVRKLCNAALEGGER